MPELEVVFAVTVVVAVPPLPMQYEVPSVRTQLIRSGLSPMKSYMSTPLAAAIVAQDSPNPAIAYVVHGFPSASAPKMKAPQKAASKGQSNKRGYIVLGFFFS